MPVAVSGLSYVLLPTLCVDVPRRLFPAGDRPVDDTTRAPAPGIPGDRSRRRQGSASANRPPSPAPPPEPEPPDTPPHLCLSDSGTMLDGPRSAADSPDSNSPSQAAPDRPDAGGARWPGPGLDRPPCHRSGAPPPGYGAAP